MNSPLKESNPSQCLPRQILPSEKHLITNFLAKNWGAPFIVSRGKVHNAEELEGICVEQEGELVGLLTYNLTGNEMEITSLDSTIKEKGLGTLLTNHSIEIAKKKSCKRLWLITSNDNLDALRFYQRRGFSLVGIHRGAINEARKIKPSIPLVGDFGIPIQDEIELEMIL